MRLPRRHLRWPALVAAAAVLAGAGTAYAATRTGGTAHYRTVAATRGDVEQTLSLSALVDAAHRADLAFGTDGTVAKVDVAQGQHVKTGQVIATLATADLDAAVTHAVATHAKAVAQLAEDRTAQSSAVASSAGANQPAKSNPSTPSSSGSATTAALLEQLKAEQQAVIDAQRTASAALAAADAALATQTGICADAYSSSGSSSSSATPTATPTVTPTTDPGSNPVLAACDTALADVQAKQAAVKAAQEAEAKALDALATTLTQALGQAGGSTHAPASARVTAATASPSAGPSAAGSGTTITAARLASDQAQIDQAAADLISARAARAQATLRATRPGRVASLTIAAGDNVSAGTAVAVVIGGSAVTLTGTVTEDHVGPLRLGQVARVTVPGSSRSTTGTVSAIGLTADSSTGTARYPVTITVEAPTVPLPAGSSAEVAIVLATAKNAVTVPISAISRPDTTGSTATVETWNGTALGRSVVTIGAIGQTRVAVTSGLTAGTAVVLADTGRAITGASNQLNNRGGFFVPGGGNGPAFAFRDGGAGGGGPSLTVGK